MIHLIDVGSWHATREDLRDRDSGHCNSYVVVLPHISHINPAGGCRNQQRNYPM